MFASTDQVSELPELTLRKRGADPGGELDGKKREGFFDMAKRSVNTWLFSIARHCGRLAHLALRDSWYLM